MAEVTGLYIATEDAYAGGSEKCLVRLDCSLGRY